MKIKNLLTILAVGLLLASCNTSKEIPYLIDANTLSQESLRAAARAADPVLMPGDLLRINVSGPDAEAVKPFNKDEYVSSQGSNNINNQENSIFYYLVDNQGDIEFPLVGKLHLGGITISAAEQLIASQIYPRYLTVMPGVEVRLQNFRVTTMGEVKNPGVIKSPNGRLTILEALAQSGDLTIQGRRDNVMIVRTNADGSRQVRTVNLNDKNLLVSPDFYLQQNDVIYVEPNASKARSSWQVPPALTLGMSSVGTLISIATLIVTLTK